MKTRALLLVLALAVLPTGASAQRNLAGLTYNFSFPAVDLQRYVGANSWYGATLDLRRELGSNPNVSLGISTGWYVFYDTAYRVSQVHNATISGEQYRNFNIVPILAGVHYMLGTPGGTRPFFGLNIGPYWARQELDVGLYVITADSWLFGGAPEFGVAFPLQPELTAYFDARYHYLFEGGDFLGGQSLTLPFFTLGVGIAWEF